jgi:hypothetical protein
MATTTYTKIIRDGAGRQVQTLVRELRHPSRRWPPITLAGVTHVGRPEYYQAVQHLLDAQSLVLYEMVIKARGFRPFDPDGMRQATHYTPEQRAAVTMQNQWWLAIRLERFRRAHKRYPATLSELIASLPRGSSGIAVWAAVDGWGRDQLYASQGGKFELTSLGSDGEPDGDGHAADIHFSHEDRLSASEIRAVPLFERLALALGLVAQSQHIDLCRPNWACCDRTVEELDAHAARAQHLQADAQTGAVAESSFAGHRKLMGGDIQSDIGIAALHRALSTVCLAISWSPGLQRAARLLLCEALDAATTDDLNAYVEASETILDFRDQLVVETLRRWIGDLPMPEGTSYGPQPDGTGVPASIGVLYGAQHMPGIETGLRQLGYEPSADRWLTAIDVRPEPEASRWDIFGRIAESLAARL